MNAYNSFLEARSLSEALLLKYAEETTGRSGATQTIDRAFQRLAEQMGYRIEKIEADTSPAAPSVFRPRPGFDANTGRPA